MNVRYGPQGRNRQAVPREAAQPRVQVGPKAQHLRLRPLPFRGFPKGQPEVVGVRDALNQVSRPLHRSVPVLPDCRQKRLAVLLGLGVPEAVDLLQLGEEAARPLAISANCSLVQTAYTGIASFPASCLRASRSRTNTAKSSAERISL